MREIILILLMAISGHAFPIVGGSQHTCEETGVYKYKFEQGEKEGGVCSGSFISPKTFITAAHCVAFLKKEGSKFLNILNDKKYEIDTYHVPGSYHEHARISFILGRHYYQNCSGQYETQKCIDLKKKFDDAYERKAYFDLGVVNLKEPVPSHYTKMKIKGVNYKKVYNSILAGYGYIRFDSFSGRCFETTNHPFTRVSQLKTKKLKKLGKTHYFQGENMGDVLSCPGDSGGSVIHKGALIGLISGSYTQKGIPGTIMVPLIKHMKFIKRFVR